MTTELTGKEDEARDQTLKGRNFITFKFCKFVHFCSNQFIYFSYVFRYVPVYLKMGFTGDIEEKWFQCETV